ncbi:MAG: YbaN family protein [Coriobacteriales bacterium]
MGRLKKTLFIGIGCLCAALGFIGMFVPVLPTTPLMLLAALLFSRSSERLNSWLAQTAPYRAYVEPFKANGGISLAKKIHILGLSFTVMGISALLVQRPLVWAILGAVAVFLLVLMLAVVPTIPKGQEQPYGVCSDADPAARCEED